MSKDNYYVVIVPHGDQAAQALTAARVAGHIHASRREPAIQHHASRVAASARGTAASKSHSAAPKRGAAHNSGARGGGAGQRVRTWSVVVGDRKYDVTDFGATCGYKIEHEGTIVWTGVLSGRGYNTHTTTLQADTLQEVLRLAYVGDQREAAKAGRSETSPPAPPSVEPKSETRAKPKQRGTRKPKAEASAPAVAAALSATPMPKSKAKRAAKAKASEPALSPTAEHRAEPTTKRPAKQKAASPRNGPPTQRAPTTPPNAMPHAHQATPSIDDKTVLDGLMKNLRKEDASNAEQNFANLKRIWLGGGREATVEWMKHHTFRSPVRAFTDWFEKNTETAKAMLARAPHSASSNVRAA